MRRLWLAMMLGVAATPCAAAQITFTDTPTQQSDKAVNKSDSDRLICEVQDELGSRLQQHKVCLTAQQWRDHRQQSRDQTELLQQKKSGLPGGGRATDPAGSLRRFSDFG